MKRILNLVLMITVALALSGFVGACSHNRNDPKGRVDKALSDANIKGVRTSFDRDADVVHLQGRVDSADTKQRAEQIATGAVGTSGKVLNELRVEGMDDRPVDDQDKLIRDTLKDEVNRDQVLQDRNISFDVNSGVVTVKGDVRTQEEKAKISELVRSVPGVKQMANELDIKPKK